ncbi:MAG: SOS response-associated peptidase, partial [Myxococcota bacterium]|nr:SOS response-associated peptidase [Myxococcota bacterium]
MLLDDVTASDQRDDGLVCWDMCGRAALTISAQDLRDAFALDETPSVEPHFNLTPSQQVAVVRRIVGALGRKLEWMQWGLVPCWAADRKVGNKLALARVETVTTSHAFREAIRKRRCLVVVDGFYEWRREGKAQRQPFFFRRPDGAPLALGGLWERWNAPDGEIVESCAIVTQPARPPADAVHDRMPLVVERETWQRWLDPSITADHALAPMLEPRTPPLVAYAVSTHVNDPKNDDARCIQPSEPVQR